MVSIVSPINGVKEFVYENKHNNPKTGERKDFETSHFLCNKQLKFEDNDIVDCDDGVYRFIGLDDENLIWW